MEEFYGIKMGDLQKHALELYGIEDLLQKSRGEIRKIALEIFMSVNNPKDEIEVKSTKIYTIHENPSMKFIRGKAKERLDTENVIIIRKGQDEKGIFYLVRNY